MAPSTKERRRAIRFPPFCPVMRKTTNEELHRPTPEAYARMPKMPVTVVLDNVRSLNNVGSFFRTCDAFAVERLVLCGITGTPPSRELHKTALGAEHTVAWCHYDATADAIADLHADGYRVLAVEQADEAVSLETFRLEPDVRYALIFGNEGSGLPGEFARLGQPVRIPSNDRIDSLNLSVAAAIGIYGFTQRQGKE